MNLCRSSPTIVHPPPLLPHAPKTMAWLSIITNCYIFGFTSEQMTVWFPSFFSGPDGDTTTALGSGRYVVGLVFGIEHFLLFAALIITWVVPKQPRWVRIDAARREYEKNQALRLARAAQHAEHAQDNHKKKNS